MPLPIERSAIAPPTASAASSVVSRPRFSLSLGLGARLARLLLQHFARVADPLLLVGIRLAQAADVRRHLTNELTIDARDRDVRLLLDRDVDPRRDVEDDCVRIAEREDDLLAFDLGAVADADDIELFLEPVGDPDDRVGDQTSREAMELAPFGILVRKLGH